MEILNLSYEEMEKIILHKVEYTYNVEKVLREEIGRMEGAGIVVEEFTFGNTKVEITINDPIEIEEDLYINRYDLKFL